MVAEDGTQNMLQFASAVQDQNKVVSALTMIEATSAISRLRREQRLLPHEANQALSFMDAAVVSMTVQPITADALVSAKALCNRYYLRALDAVQLGCAIDARNIQPAPDMSFVASDAALLEAAKSEGFSIWNPQTTAW